VGVKGLSGIAKSLRKRPTDAELRLWRHLRDRPIERFKFRRQQPIGRFIVDFVNLERKVVVEMDGVNTLLTLGIRFVTNGVDRKATRYSDSGTTRYSVT
jgi:Protein of unknown function (DUF559)